MDDAGGGAQKGNQNVVGFFVVLLVAVEFEADHHVERASQRVGVDLRAVAGDHAVFFQAEYPLADGGARHADRVADFFV